MDGAYDTVNVIKPFLIEKVELDIESNKFLIEEQILTNLVKPALIALTLLSFSDYSQGNIGLDKMLEFGFYKMNCTSINQYFCDVPGYGHVNLTRALKVPHVDNIPLVESILNSALKKSQNGETYLSDPLSIVFGTNNSALALVNNATLTSP